jgi:hypothetical protein
MKHDQSLNSNQRSISAILQNKKEEIYIYIYIYIYAWEKT